MRYLYIMIAIVIFASSAQAENLVQPKPKQGYYLQFAPTASIQWSPSTDRTVGPWPGAGFNIRLGEALTHRFDLGVGGGAAWSFSSNYRAIVGHFSIEATIKPSEFLYVQLGAGIGFTDFTRTNKQLERPIGRFGGTYTVMVGYDFFPGHKGQSGGVSLSPFIAAQAGPADSTSTYALFTGIAITRWTGLPKNKLDLDIEDAFTKE